MATINQTLRFNNLTKSIPDYRAKIVAVGVGRVKINRGSVNIWVTTSITLAVNDYALISNNIAISKLPQLPYQEVTVY